MVVKVNKLVIQLFVCNKLISFFVQLYFFFKKSKWNILTPQAISSAQGVPEKKDINYNRVLQTKIKSS